MEIYNNYNGTDLYYDLNVDIDNKRGFYVVNFMNKLYLFDTPFNDHKIIIHALVYIFMILIQMIF